MAPPFDVSIFPEGTFTLHGSLRAKPGRGDELETLLRKIVGIIPSEHGVLTYQVARDKEDPLRFLIFETYTGRAAFSSHLETQQFKDFWNAGVLDGALKPSFFEALTPL
ncbi:hypothetical protein V1509DRAFT_633238 [Lipomyces kononenkoae]